MNYHAFPSERPNQDTLVVSIRAALEEYYKTRPTTTDMIEVCRATPDGIHTEMAFRIPCIYARPLLQLLFRRYSLALVLHHEKELRIEPYNRWLVLTQNFLYLDLVWNRLEHDCTNEPTMGPKWRSANFDQFIATEVVVRRHEPVYVSVYRRQRTDKMPNISQVSVDALGEYFVSHCLPVGALMYHRLD